MHSLLLVLAAENCLLLIINFHLLAQQLEVKDPGFKSCQLQCFFPINGACLFSAMPLLLGKDPRIARSGDQPVRMGPRFTIFHCSWSGSVLVSKLFLVLVRSNPRILKFDRSSSELVRDFFNFPGPGPGPIGFDRGSLLLGLKFIILDLDRANSHSFSKFKTGTCFGTCDKTQSDRLVDGFVYTIL